jgi:alpha-glucosidase
MEKTNILVFTRNSTDSQRLIVINLSDTPQTISLPEQLLNKGWQPLIATINPIPEISQSIHLQPFQSIIWYN